MKDSPGVLILIVNWNNLPDTKACLESLKLLTYDNYQVMVVDNGSNDGSADFIRKGFPDIQIVDLAENLGFAGGNNVGLRYAETEKIPYTLLLNNDTTIQDGSFLGRLVEVMEEEQEVGAVGPAVEQTDGQTQLSILPYPSLYNSIRNSLGLYHPDHSHKQFVDSIAGCCVLVRTEIQNNIGLLDENYFMYGEETEWFFRMRNTGWKILYLPIKSIVHKGSASIDMLVRQDIYIERRANLIYTLVKHNQIFQAAATTLLMLALLFLRCVKSRFSTDNHFPFSMLKELWKITINKWNLAVSIG